MKTLKLIIASFLLMGTMNIQAQTNEPNNKETNIATETINVYYFHNTRRCETCKAVESVTMSTLEDSFPEQMKNGEITFESLNIEKEENEPLARKLHVSGQALLFVKNGNKKDMTSDAFMYARTNPDKLKEKILKTIENL
ncbi:MAG: hypothetical protein GXO89_00295 [Chlorobi bacterium]|nr:hypothetical protein [Chlorobiota bacterium]